MTPPTGKPRLNRKRWPDACPKCNADSGRPCTTPKGKVTDDHLARRDPTRAKERPTGRPSLLSPAVEQTICTALEQGVPLNVAALAAGINSATLHRWLARADTPLPPEGDDDPDHPYRAFREAVTRARATGQVRLVGVLQAATVGGQLKEKITRTLRDGTTEVTEKFTEPDWRAASFVLERSYGREFGRRDVLALTPGDDVEPTAAAAAGGGAAADVHGVERVATQLATFRQRKQLEAEQRGQDGGPIEDAEVVDG